MSRLTTLFIASIVWSSAAAWAQPDPREDPFGKYFKGLEQRMDVQTRLLDRIGGLLEESAEDTRTARKQEAEQVEMRGYIEGLRQGLEAQRDRIEQLEATVGRLAQQNAELIVRAQTLEGETKLLKGESEALREEVTLRAERQNTLERKVAALEKPGEKLPEKGSGKD